MNQLPEELIRFLERPVPLFVHVAAARPGQAPFVCRGYAVRADFENHRIWIAILKSQWPRLSEYLQEQPWLAALLTAGTDNESYQIKGAFSQHRTMTKDDHALMERQRNLVADVFPHLLPVVAVASSDCLMVSMQVTDVYLQTPGPHAGSLLTERRL